MIGLRELTAMIDQQLRQCPLVSTQRFRDAATIERKRRNRDYGVQIIRVNVPGIGAARYVVDGHHSLEAARRDGVPPQIHDVTGSYSAQRDGDGIPWLQRTGNDPLYFISTGREVFPGAAKRHRYAALTVAVDRYAGLFRDEDHPRDESGQFATKESRAGGAGDSKSNASGEDDEPFTLRRESSRRPAKPVFEGGSGAKQKSLFDDANDLPGQKRMFAASDWDEVTNDRLFQRTGRQFEALQRTLGIANPQMGQVGADAIRAALSHRPGGPVIAAILGVHADHPAVEYNDFGMPQGGMDAFRPVLQGRFTEEQILDALRWAASTDHVDGYRWITGELRNASTVEGKTADRDKAIAATMLGTQEGLGRRELYARRVHPLTAAIDRYKVLSSGQWQKVGGASVFVSAAGTILKGCPGLKGEDIDDLIDEDDESRHERKVRQDVATAKGLSGHDVTARDARKLHSPTHRKVHAAASAEAKRRGLPVQRVLANMASAHQRLQEYHRDRETAKAAARKRTGLTAGDLARMENTGTDHSSLRGFDTAAREIAMENPLLGFDPWDATAQVWDLIREGKVAVPSAWDERVAEEAANMTAVEDRSSKSHPLTEAVNEAFEDDFFRDDDANAEFAFSAADDVVPFSRRGPVAKYRALIRALDVRTGYCVRYAFDPNQNRDELGRWAEDGGLAPDENDTPRPPRYDLTEAINVWINEGGARTTSELPSRQLPPGTIQGSSAEISQLYDAVLRGDSAKASRVAFARVSPSLAKLIADRLSKAGMKVVHTVGWHHVIASDAIQHIHKNHGDPKKEQLRGQLPVTREDVARIPEIVAKPEEVTISRDNKGKVRVEYKKTFESVVWYYEEILEGRQFLSGKTMLRRMKK